MSAITTTQIPTGTFQIDPIHSTVGFAVKHMVVSTFRGRFEDYSGELRTADDGSLQLVGTVRADSILVKDENLAGHLKSPDFFDAEQYPELRFVSSAISIDGERVELVGDLTIKDRTHQITAHGTISGPHENIAGIEAVGVELEAEVDRREYGLDWNAPLPKGGFALDNTVKLQVALELHRQEA
jgi:polyisoprenoid-binding protein YceI